MAKFRNRLVVTKQTMHRVNMERLNIKKLNEVEGKGQCRVEVSNWFQLWKAYVLWWILIEVEKLFENIKTSAKENLG